MAKTIPGVRWDAKRERWFIDYYDRHGERHREYGIRGRPFRSQKEAADALASRRQDILADRYGWKPRKASPPFGEHLDWYLRTYSPEKRSHKVDLVNAKPLKAYFGSKRVAEINPSDVQAYKTTRSRDISRRTKRPISQAKIDLELNLLKAVFSRAVEAGRVEKNPVKGVKLFRPDNRRSRVLTGVEMEKLFAVLAPYVRRPVQVMLSTGLRVSEVMHLKREDVFFKDGGASLRVQRKGGRQQIITLDWSLTNLLRDVVKSLPEAESSHAPLWRKPNGQRLKSFRTAWENACKSAGIQDLWVHDLRRTFGTKALENGTDIVTVRDQLGQSNTYVTERYLWPEARRQKEAVETVAAWVNKALNGQQSGIIAEEQPTQVFEK